MYSTTTGIGLDITQPLGKQRLKHGDQEPLCSKPRLRINAQR